MKKEIKDIKKITNKNQRVFLIDNADQLVGKNTLWKNIVQYYGRDKAKKFKKGSIEKGPNITTGYINREIYKSNPLTHMDFRKYLDTINRSLYPKEIFLIANREKISDRLFNNSYELLSKVIESIKEVICTNPNINNIFSFQLFGADVAINENLDAQIIEINKGPDLGAKDSKDKKVKHSVVEDMLKVMKIIPDINHGFIKIFD
jgi:hypothetical protein